MYQLFVIVLAVATCQAIFGLGLLGVAWRFRRDEPQRRRKISSRRAMNAAFCLAAGLGPTALLWLAPRMGAAIGLVVIPPLIAAAIMGEFFGRLNHPRAADGPVDPEI